MILHGLLGSARNWHSIASKLAERLRIVVPSLRNHGDSPHGEHTVDAMCGDIVELMDALSHRQIALVGHSMGGMVAMKLATEHPERVPSLVVADMGPAVQLQRLSPLFEALNTLEVSKLQSRADADRQLAEYVSDHGIRQFLLQNLKRNQAGAFAWRCNLGELTRFIRKAHGNFLPPEAVFAGPTLFIGGGRSEHAIGGQRELISRHFPGYELAILPDAGHWLHFDAPEQFTTMVSDFLSGV